MSVNSKMTALADQVRTLSGGTGVLGIDAMTDAVKDSNDEIGSQGDLIAQISAALEGKAAGGGITPTGTIEITENGTHDVTNYAAAEVNVPSEEPVLQEKSVTPTKSQQTVTPSSGYDGLSKVIVGKIPDTYVAPSGTKEITANGEYDVTTYAKVDVNVPSEEPNIQPLTVTENGTWTPSGNVDGYGPVTVNVPGPVTEELSVTANGTYTPGSGVDGFSKVVVDVPISGGSGDATGSFTPVENLSDSTKTLEIDVGFRPSAVAVYRKAWARGTPSINLSFTGDFHLSICNTSGSSKAVEKLMGGPYMEITDTGFTVVGNATYYWVGGAEYGYAAWK